MAFVVERLCENFEEPPKQAGADPVLKSPVAGLIRRIAVREVRPRGPGPQNRKDAVEYGAVLLPGAPAAVCTARERGQEGADEGPVLVGEVTGMRHRKKGYLARMPFMRRAASDTSVATPGVQSLVARRTTCSIDHQQLMVRRRD